MSLRILKRILTVTLLIATLQFSNAQQQGLRLQSLLDSLCKVGDFPGLNLAIVQADNSVIALSSGFNDKEENLLLKPSDRMLHGSVGKTYVSAVALQLIQAGKIKLDEKVSDYLGHYAWYSRVPNANDITIRMLMNHTSGIMRYEFKETFENDVTRMPDKVWKPEELIGYVLDEPAAFEAGKGWEYSDTNYIVLGMIIEQVTDKKYYELMKANLKKLGLKNTFPSDSRKLKGLAQGYAGAENAFGKQEKVIGKDGKFIINPQFEWTGGGVYGTAEDLARWGKYLYEGKLFSDELSKEMLDGVPAKLGKDAKYGLGVIIRPSSYGTTYGHSGFFPGYLTEMVYFPDYDICITIQTNSSDLKNLKLRPYRCVLEIARVALKK